MKAMLRAGEEVVRRPSRLAEWCRLTAARPYIENGAWVYLGGGASHALLGGGLGAD